MEYLYVCHFSNGHIKVGRSISPKARIASHADRVACVGIELVEHQIFECVGHSAPAESALIDRCTELATKRNKSEWFEGLDFLDVCTIASSYAIKVFEFNPSTFGYVGHEITPEKRKLLAKKLNLSEQYLYQCLTGRRDMGPVEVRRVESESDGVLTRQMLCQKTWRLIWPELQEQAAA